MKDTYHFIGLGGIGMSALARILIQRGESVQGSDCVLSPLLEQLGLEGACIQVGHHAAFVEKATAVIYSSDIKEENEELAKAKELGLPILHRSDLLDQLMHEKKTLLVTGTHGKTTTSALLSWVLHVAHFDPTFAIGGILLGLNTNGKAGQGIHFVAEADESDGSFLKTPPFGAIVTSLNNDHMNYWKTQANLDAGFHQFFSKVKSPLHLFWCCDDKRLKGLDPPGFSYGFSPISDLSIKAFSQDDQGIHFDLEFQGNIFPHIALSLFGKHNALNGAAVFGLALQLHVPQEVIRQAFLSFSGTKRRLELKGEAHKIKVFDDYGHHPVEIHATLKALRHIARERRIVAIFQPHRYTRLRDLFEDFLSCFGNADLVILTDIYVAGEAPIEGITTAALYARLKEKLKGKLHFFPRQHLELSVAEILKPLDVVLTLGAGDITDAGNLILQKLAEKAPRTRVALLCGGISAEHEVSILSAIHLAKALDRSVYDVRYFGVTKEGRWIHGTDTFEKLKGPEPLLEPKISSAILEELSQCEVSIPVFHGPQGEDGMIQGFLDTLQIPYVGCDYRSGAICMHKGWTKRLALMHHVPIVPFLEMDIREYRENPRSIFEKIEERFTYPVWVKPAHLGSSIAVRRADDLCALQKAVENAYSYDDCILIEPHIEGRQIEFGILGNEYLRVGPSCEILNKGAFVDYGDKYGPNAMPYAIPARLSEIEEALGIDLAKTIYLAARCRGLARVDFFIDHDGCFWFNEINSFPGCTNTSAFPKIWAAAGVSMEHICDDLIASAFQRKRHLEAISYRS